MTNRRSFLVWSGHYSRQLPRRKHDCSLPVQPVRTHLRPTLSTLSTCSTSPHRPGKPGSRQWKRSSQVDAGDIRSRMFRRVIRDAKI
jgi:hypothetical protein